MDILDIKRDNDPVDALGAFPVHTPDGMLAVSDLLRRCSAHMRGLHTREDAGVLARDVDAAARSLGVQHMVMCREMGARSKSFFAAEFMIQCLLFGGWVKSTHDLLPALEDAISISVPFEKHKDYLLKLIRGDHKPPSATVMYRHRLMLAFGYCSYRAEANRRLFEGGDEVVRFCTMDGSPQHGYDWLIHGSINLLTSTSECVHLYHVAIEYINRWLRQQAGGVVLHEADHRTQQLHAQLASSLERLLNLPIAVGSGKAGVRHKFHGPAAQRTKKQAKKQTSTNAQTDTQTNT